MRLDRIDTRWGTQNTHRFGRGNTLPYTGVPFGMNHFVLETRPDESRFFHPEDGSTTGIRLTHQPSPWMGDFCHVTWHLAQFNEAEMRQLGTDLTAETSRELSYSGYRSDRAHFHPHYLAYQRLRDGLWIECCPTTYGASLRAKADRRYPKGQWVMSLVWASQGWCRVDGGQLTLYTNQLAGSKYHRFGQYHRWVLPEGVRCREIQRLDLGTGLQQGWFLLEGALEGLATSGIDWVTSYLNEDQLALEYQRSEFFGATWQDKCAQTRSAWEDYLGRVEVAHGDTRWCNRFYHCLYRTATFPQVVHEADLAGRRYHRSPYTGQIEPGAFYTNNGYWDTFRTNYPLYALVIPEQVPLFMEGILSVAREDGFLPKWLSPDERGLMPGTLVDAVIADAVVKGLVDQDLAQQLYQAMVTSATKASPHPLEGREGGQVYQDLGFLPADYGESINKTLDYAYSDFCIGQVAAALGREEEAQDYWARSYHYRHLFDSATGLMRPRLADGSWAPWEDSHDWGGAYTEGSAWQQSFAVYHNLADLIALHGGDHAFYQHIQHLVNQAPYYRVGGYGYEIHEMLEMAGQDLGQLALSNQPSFHLPYLLIYAGFPHFSHQLIKSLLDGAFLLEHQGYIGDEDNGSLSAWFVLSSLGLYAVTPGTSQYVLGISIWDWACLHLPSGKTFEWSTLNPATHLSLVQARYLNQAPYRAEYVDYNQIMAGGHLEQELGWLPDLSPIEPALRPFSLATGRGKEYNRVDLKIEGV